MAEALPGPPIAEAEFQTTKTGIYIVNNMVAGF